MKRPIKQVAMALLGTLAIGLALPASAHGGHHRGWGEHHRYPPQAAYGYGYGYAQAPIYVAPRPQVVVRQAPVVYQAAPVYAYPVAPAAAITIGLPPVVIPLR